MAQDSKAAEAKPRKPSKDFPLFAHACGLWAKKVRGRMFYFGPWRDPQAALEKWLRDKDYRLAGLEPPDPNAAAQLTITELSNHFLTAKKALVKNGELSSRTFADYHASCERLIEHFGKSRAVATLTPNDFLSLRESIAKTRGSVSLGNEVNRVRVVFNFAFRNDLIDKPARFGTMFARPSLRTLRQERNARPPRLLTAEQLRELIDAAGVQLRAQILLGVNCALGNHDIGTITIDALDLDKGWLNFPRVKTAIPRRCRLWPQTIAAVRAAMKERPEPLPATHQNLLFVTRTGNPFVRHHTQTDPQTGEFKEAWIDGVNAQFTRLLRSLKMKESRVSFYALRRIVETIGGECKDQVAVDAVLGHVDPSMGAQYRETIADARLQAVTDTVKKWLWPMAKRTTPATKKGRAK